MGPILQRIRWYNSRMKKPIYFDYAATTPVDPRVAKAMGDCLTLEGQFGNPASNTHAYGWDADDAVSKSRRQVAALIGAKPSEIIWTSGATESNNLAIKGAYFGQTGKKNHIITVATEHKAVLDTCRFLEKHHGVKVTFMKPQCNGLIDLAALRAAITPETLLISVMHVNNEIGVVQDIQAISALAKEKDVLFHVDAAQSAGKLPIDVTQIPVDCLSISAHKMYGPKGIGVLFVRDTVQAQIQAQMHGGGHERGLRSGTLATHQIVGMGVASEIAASEMQEEQKRLSALREQLWQGIADLPGITRHGCIENCSPHHLNVSFEGLSGEMLLEALSDIAISSGSACNSAAAGISHVLDALGVPKALAQATLRITVGRFTTDEDIQYAIKHINEQVKTLQSARENLWEIREKNEHTSD